MKYSDIVKKHMAFLYDGVCDIYDYEKQQGAINNTVKVLKQQSVPCRLSYSNSPQSEQSQSVSKISQTIKLFLPPEIEITEGCVVVVTQEGETNSFCCAGKALKYGSHKEIVLELEKGCC